MGSAPNGAVDMTANTGDDFFFIGGAAPALETNANRIALIDGDMIVYAAAFRAEGKDFRVGTSAVVEKVNACLRETGSSSCRIYLTGKDNFRFDYATILEYKGNRADRERPEWFDDLRAFMVEDMGAIVVEGKEADDRLVIDQHQFLINYDPSLDFDSCQHSVICSGDKDLRQSAGYFYNLREGSLEWLDAIGKLTLIKEDKKTKVVGSGMMFFFYQMLVGDTVDNIMGAGWLHPKLAEKYGCRRSKGLGPVAAYSVLSDLESSTKGIIEAEKRVKEVYWKAFGYHAKCFYLENARLLWMQRYHDEVFDFNTIEHTLNDLGVEYD